MLENLAVFQPVPQVRRVVFMSTPHRGSYLVNSLALRFMHGFVSLPVEVVKTSKSILTMARRSKLENQFLKTVPTSIDSMSPKNPGLLALAALPVAGHVTAHSIIAIQGHTEPPSGELGLIFSGSRYRR